MKTPQKTLVRRAGVTGQRCGVLREEACSVMGESQACCSKLASDRSSGESGPAAGDAARRPVRQSDELLHWVLLALSVGVLGLSLVLHTGGGGHVAAPLLSRPLPSVCAFKRLTGLDCPGCGLTRSFISLAHRQWRAAWSYNPAGPIALVIVLFQVPYRVVQIGRIRRGRMEFQLGFLGSWCLGLLALALLTQWIVRTAGRALPW